MSEPALKCENNAILSKSILKYCFFLLNGLFLLFQLRGKSRFSRISPKKFYNINYSGEPYKGSTLINVLFSSKVRL